jgi:hypothetical protein
LNINVAFQRRLLPSARNNCSASYQLQECPPSVTLNDSIANVVYKNLVTKLLVVREVGSRF